MSLHWLKTRWRTRGEYAVTGHRLLWRFGLAVAGPLEVSQQGVRELGRGCGS